MSKEAQRKVLKTAFQKGNIPKAHREVGSERIDRDGYILIKTKEPNKWEFKHRYIYESLYGSIPTGHKLIFADGNRQNVDINNLILVSNAEELIMNSRGLYKRNAELTRTGSLIAKLINKTSKANKLTHKKEI